MSNLFLDHTMKFDMMGIAVVPAHGSGSRGELPPGEFPGGKYNHNPYCDLFPVFRNPVAGGLQRRVAAKGTDVIAGTNRNFSSDSNGNLFRPPAPRTL